VTVPDLVGGLTAVVVLAVAALPGAAYTWGFERSAGPWEQELADRTLRFLGASAVFHVLFAPLTFWIYREAVGHGSPAQGRFWWPAWPLALAYLAVPFVAGRLIGSGARSSRPWARLLVGDGPAPRAWDHLFSAGRSAWLRIRLKDPTAATNGWIVGVFAPHEMLGAYAGAGPQPDLYLSDTAEVHPGTGEMCRGPDGKPVLRGVGVLVRYEEILYLEVRWG
jgi:hypothetical protein